MFIIDTQYIATGQQNVTQYSGQLIIIDTQYTGQQIVKQYPGQLIIIDTRYTGQRIVKQYPGQLIIIDTQYTGQLIVIRTQYTDWPIVMVHNMLVSQL